MNDPLLLGRRDFLGLAAVAGVAFASGLSGCGGRPEPRGPAPAEDFFLQLSDTHWGYRGDANPEADVTLERAVATIVASPIQPDFIVFTGDLTHTTDDPQERRRRMRRFRGIASPLGAKVHFLAGEHDASLDHGEAFREAFGPTRWAFRHKGVAFVGLDNVSNGAAIDEHAGATASREVRR